MAIRLRWQERFTCPRALLITAVACSVTAVIIWWFWQGLKVVVSDRYLARGDASFTLGHYRDAEAAYKEAVAIDAGNITARERAALVPTLATDPAAGESLFAQLGMTSVITSLRDVRQGFTSAKDALEKGISYSQKGEDVFARYALEQAVAIDPGYPEAWHYLAQTYGRLAQIDSIWKASQDRALATRDRLTPKYLQEGITP